MNAVHYTYFAIVVVDADGYRLVSCSAGFDPAPLARNLLHMCLYYIRSEARLPVSHESVYVLRVCAYIIIPFFSPVVISDSIVARDGGELVISGRRARLGFYDCERFFNASACARAEQ